MPISFPAENLTSPIWDVWCHTRRHTREDPRCLYNALQVGGKLLHTTISTAVLPWSLGAVLCPALGTSCPAKAPSEAVATIIIKVGEDLQDRLVQPSDLTACPAQEARCTRSLQAAHRYSLAALHATQKEAHAYCEDYYKSWAHTASFTWCGNECKLALSFQMFPYWPLFPHWHRGRFG